MILDVIAGLIVVPVALVLLLALAVNIADWISRRK